MRNQRLQTIGFFVLLALAVLVIIRIFWPFWELLAFAGVLAILFQPWHQKILAWIKSPSWSAFFTMLLVLIIVIIPLGVIGYSLFLEANNLLNGFKTGNFSFDEAAIVGHLPVSLQAVGRNFLENFYQWVSQLTGSAVQNITGLIANVVNFFFGCFLVFFSLFFLLRDGPRLKDFFSQILPLSKVHESVIIEKLIKATDGVIKGSFLIALIQGGVATAGFLIFGVPQPFLWGAFTVLAALVPTVGTSLSLIPAILYLLLTGHIGAGIGLIIWGVAAVGLIDNVVSPKLIGSKTSLHPLLVLFSVLGGLQVFGVLGFLFGPILMAVFVALLDIYKTDLQAYWEK
jgi:predicted PurR-regulated permease PerM